MQRIQLTRAGFGGKDRGGHSRLGINLCFISSQAMCEKLRAKMMGTSARGGLGHYPNGEIRLAKRLV